MFALTTFIIGDNELRGLLLAHLVSAGGSGARLAEAYAYPLLPKDESGLQVLQVNRKDQAGAKNTTKMMDDFYESQRGGMLPGYMGRDWWSVGKRKNFKNADNDDIGPDRGSSGGGGISAVTSSTQPKVSVGAMKMDASGQDALYGKARKKFSPPRSSRWRPT